jgi:hypothetical protein
MDQGNWLAERFEENRARLRAVAYRMLGSPGEADDAVQEAWLRFSRTDSSAVEQLAHHRGVAGVTEHAPGAPVAAGVAIGRGRSPNRPRLTPDTRRFSPSPSGWRFWWCSTR